MAQITLIIIVALVFLAVGLYIGIKITKYRTKEALQRQRPILKGNISEELAPFLPGFPKDLKLSEARFVGKPIDFIVFKGMDDKNITEVVFLEVKTGESHLNTIERTLKNAIEEKKVRWVPYRFRAPKEIEEKSEELPPKL